MGLPIADATLPWLVAAGIALVIAVVAGLGARRRKRRADLDRIGWIDWPTLQMVALIAAAILGFIALHD